MERYPMFLDRKVEHCEHDCLTQSHLQTQCKPYQIINGSFHRIRTKKVYNLYGNTEDPKLPKQSWEREMELEESAPWVRLYWKATVIKTGWHSHKNGNRDPWSSTESPEKNPGTYGQLVQFSSVAQSYPTLCNPINRARPPCPSPTPRVHSDSRPSLWPKGQKYTVEKRQSL